MSGDDMEQTKSPEETEEKKEKNPPPGSVEQNAPDTDLDNGHMEPFPVVGVGASAGGLEALKKFLVALPPDIGMAFVLIQHLDPTHESLMVDLLTRYTTMKVVQIANDMPVEPDRIHIIPPGTSLTIKNGVLLLGKPIERRGMRMPVDNFFMSLAEDQQENSVCIILSGTGSDGTLGLKEIKARGGLAIVQDPETAQYDGMPRSAIMTGLVDYILPVEQIPETLVGYVRHSLKVDRLAEPLMTEAEEQLHRILTLLHVRTGHDFRYYKRNTLVRRLQRRMTVKHITTLGDYLDLIQSHPEELEALDKDLLISVTMFFREPEVWEALHEMAIPKLVDRCTENQPVRIWVPGCATGEEAYSLAIMLLEESEGRKRECPVQIYATDIDKEALEIGRRGAYPENIAEQVSHERLTRYFTKDANGMYQVNKRLREMVVFAPQNLISDPPFSKLDLVSCRNVLIYIQLELQKKIVTLFHFALRDGGFLVLGNSESVGTRTDLFEPLSKRWRIFRQISTVGRIPLDLPLSLDLGKRPGDLAFKPAVPLAVRYADIAKGQLIQKFTPPSVLVNNRYETLFFSGVTKDFLSIPEGTPTDNVIDMADPGLRPKLRTALHKAGTENREVVLGGVKLAHGDGSRTVRLTAQPVIEGKEEAGLFLVSFEFEPQREPGPASRPEDITEESVVRSLEEELKRSREELQATIEQMETSNEELKASNEEVMSMNEELQSSNEELETSREELQSLNEELSTLNSQLQDKVNELEVTTDDLNNLLTSTSIATIFMSEDFRIKRYTPAATGLLNLIPGDVGRPLVDITRKFSDDTLFDDAKSVLHNLQPLNREVRSDDGKWFLRSILPYRTQDNRIEGVVVTFSDFSEMKQAQEALQKAAETARLQAAELEAIMEAVPAAILISRDPKCLIINGNRAAYELLRMQPGSNTSKSNPEAKVDHFRVFHDDRETSPENLPVQRAATDGVPIRDYEEKIVFDDGNAAWVYGNAVPLLGPHGDPAGAVAAFIDISEHKKAEEEKFARNRELEELNKELEAFNYSISHDLRAPLRIMGGFAKALKEDYADKLDEQGRDYLTRISKGSEKMTRLIDELLNLSRISRKKAQRVNVDMSKLAASTVAALREIDPGRTVEVSIQEGLSASADPTLMELVLSNLIGNAWKFTEKTPNAHIEFGAKESRNPKPETVYFVKDNGAGFDPVQAEKLFLPFQRLHSEKEFEGTGIGLAIVERIIRIHGGRVWADGGTNEGAVFYFSVG
jgi:two-component system CheB/CheR fusion protein